MKNIKKSIYIYIYIYIYITLIGLLISCSSKTVNPYVDVSFTYFTHYNDKPYNKACITIPILSGSYIEQENAEALIRKFTLDGYYISKFSQVDEENYNINKSYTSPDNMPQESFITKSESDLTKLSLMKDTNYIVYYKPVVTQQNQAVLNDVAEIGSSAPADSLTKLNWESTVPSVATVDQNGKVTAVGDGVAKIIAKDDLGNVVYETEFRVIVSTTGVKFKKNKLEIPANKKIKLNYLLIPSSASNTNVTFTSSDPEQIEVDSDGFVFASDINKSATITITTEDGGFTDTCEVSTIKAIESLELDQSHLILWDGEGAKLSHSIYPEDVKYTDVTYSVVTGDGIHVDDEGNVTVDEGVASEGLIVCQSSDGEHKAYCTVSARQHVKSISFEEVTSDLDIGEEKFLKVNFTPSNAFNKKLTLVSADSSIEVVQGQVIRAKSVNTQGVQITATSQDNSQITATCTVRPYKFIKSLEFENDSYQGYIWDNESITRSVKVFPEDATYKDDFTWSISNSDNVTFDSTTGKVTAKDETDVQNLKITCLNTQQPDISLDYNLDVRVRLKSISFEDVGESDMDIGTQKSLSVVYNPVNAYNKSVKFSSSTENLSVNDEGVVTAVSVNENSDEGAGYVTITATSEENEDIKIEQDFRPFKFIQSVTFTDTSDVELWDSGNGNTLSAKEIVVTPADATFAKDDFFEWTSSDPAKITVDDEGTLTGVKEKDGQVTITYQNTHQRNIKATYKAKNKVRVQSITVTGGNKTIDGNNGNAQLGATISPSNAYCKEVTWSSNGTNIKVDSNGKVTASNGEDSKTITCKTKEEGSNISGTTTISSVKITQSWPDTINYMKIDKDSTSSGFKIYTFTALQTTLTCTTVPSGKTVTWKNSGFGNVTGSVSGSNYILTGTSIPSPILNAECPPQNIGNVTVTATCDGISVQKTIKCRYDKTWTTNESADWSNW